MRLSTLTPLLLLIACSDHTASLLDGPRARNADTGREIARVPTCTHGGRSYSVGEIFSPDGCNTCFCLAAGELSCSMMSCHCRDASDDNPHGRAPLQVRSSVDGDWRVALRQSAAYNPVTITAAGPKDAAATIDHGASPGDVAGFLLSRESTTDTIQDEPVLSGSTSTTTIGAVLSTGAGGTLIKSHDFHDSLQGAGFLLQFAASSDVATVRDQLLAFFLERKIGDLGNLPAPHGDHHRDFIVRFFVVKRVEFVRDADGNLVLDSKGHPVASDDRGKRRLLIMGAVAPVSNYNDHRRATGLLVDDLSDGTALSSARGRFVSECDFLSVPGVPEPMPISLTRYPISASLGAALDGIAIVRSRIYGFDYRPATNSIVLIGLKHSPGSQVVVAYSRWQ